MQKSPSKPPSFTGRVTLPSTTPRGPVPVRLDLKAMRAGTSPHRWSKSPSKAQPGTVQDTSRGPQSTPQSISKPNFGSSVGALGRSIQVLSESRRRPATAPKQPIGRPVPLSAQRSKAGQPYDSLSADKQDSANFGDIQNLRIS